MKIFDKLKLISPDFVGMLTPQGLHGDITNPFYTFRTKDTAMLISFTAFYMVSPLHIQSINYLLEKDADNFSKLQDEIDYTKFVEAIKNLNKEYKLNKLLMSIEKELAALLKCDGTSTLLYNASKNVLNFFVISGKASGKIETIDVPIEGSIAGYIFKNDRSYIFNDIESTPFHFKQTDKESGFHTYNIIGTTLRYHNIPVGVVEAVNKKSGFSDIDLEILETFAIIMSNKLLNSKLYEDMSRLSKDVILSFASAIDLRDKYTHMHSQNVTAYSVSIAKEMGYDDNFTDTLEIASLIHDIGKIGIPDEILNKKDKLTEEEFNIIKSHTTLGAEILSDVDLINNQILNGPLEHHEKLDGSGYPFGKKDDQISDIGKILSVADIYDALTTERPYKKAWNKEDAIAFLRKDQDIKHSKKVIDALELFLSKI